MKEMQAARAADCNHLNQQLKDIKAVGFVDRQQLADMRTARIVDSQKFERQLEEIKAARAIECQQLQQQVDELRAARAVDSQKFEKQVQELKTFRAPYQLMPCKESSHSASELFSTQDTLMTNQGWTIKSYQVCFCLLMCSAAFSAVWDAADLSTKFECCIVVA